VVDEMELLVNKYKVKEIRFDDDTFALKKSHVLDIADEIIRRNLHKKIRWACFGHASQDDPQIYAKIKEAGCFRIDFGIESGSQRILDSANKKLDLQKAKNTVKICKSAGLEVYCDFMIGFPDEEKEDVQKTLDLALEIDADFIQASYVIPYPGTRMYAEGIKNNFLIYPADWEKYNCQNTLIKTKLSPEEIDRYYLLLWRKFYLRPKIVFRRFLSMFTSFNNFKRVLYGFKSFVERYL
jgi:anaerobic magnesium-protoporphyrin IX monomethyl ester cyclase